MRTSPEDQTEATTTPDVPGRKHQASPGTLLLFIIRVKRELKRVYRNGCRYNERLNPETGGSKTTRTHWVARVNI
jgi:hypothetical protein